MSVWAGGDKKSNVGAPSPAVSLAYAPGDGVDSQIPSPHRSAGHRRMTESEPKKELGAVARSIDALFADAPPAAERAAEVPGSPDENPAGDGDAAAPDAAAPEAAAAEAAAPEAAAAEAAAPEAAAPEAAAAEAAAPEAAEAGAADSADAAVTDADAESPEPESPAAEAEVDAGVDGSPMEDTAAAPAASDTGTAESEREGDAVESGDDMTWEPVAEEPEAGPADAPEAVRGPVDTDAFMAAVDHFLASPPLERDGQALALREMVSALRDANALDPLANAVERIILSGGDEPDEASLAIADSMVSAGVASRIVARLGLERDPERRAELMRVAKEIGLEMAIALSDALSDNTDSYARRTFMDAMIQLGPTAMVVLEQMIEDRSWFVVRNAVTILGEVGGERAAELVTSALANTDARVRREGLLALAKLGGEAAGEDAGLLVFGMLDDPDAKVQEAAMTAAGALKVERALKPLLAKLEVATDQDGIEAVIRALGQLGDPGAVHAIEKHAVGGFLKRPPVDQRITAYRALHSIGTPHASKLVADAVDDKDPQVRDAVRAMLAQG